MDETDETRTRWLHGLPRHRRPDRGHPPRCCLYRCLCCCPPRLSRGPCRRPWFLGLRLHPIPRSRSQHCYRYRCPCSSPQSGSQFADGWIQEEVRDWERRHGTVNVEEAQRMCHPFPIVVLTFFACQLTTNDDHSDYLPRKWAVSCLECRNLLIFGYARFPIQNKVGLV